MREPGQRASRAGIIEGCGFDGGLAINNRKEAIVWNSNECINFLF